MRRPERPWRTLRGATGNYQIHYYTTKAERDVAAQILANLDDEFVITELWSADHPQDALNKGWAMDGKAEPGGARIYTEETITSALNRAADDILEAVEPNEAILREALNLLVNVTLHYLEFPDENTVIEAIDANYDDAPEIVLSWLSE